MGKSKIVIQNSKILFTPISGSGKEKMKVSSAVRQHVAEKVAACRLLKNVQIQGL